MELAPITDKDHIKGNPDAEILILEYSDFECPFCAVFHGTMTRIMDEYADSGKVAWVYRHLPLSGHKSARPAAEASECVANLGGENKFWDFSDLVFAGQDEDLSNEKFKEYALGLGINEGEYDSCVENKTYSQNIEDDLIDVANIAKVDPNIGTPYSILITKNGIQVPLGGAAPYANVKQVIEAVLNGPSEEASPEAPESE